MDADTARDKEDGDSPEGLLFLGRVDDVEGKGVCAGGAAERLDSTGCVENQQKCQVSLMRAWRRFNR